MTTDDVIVDDGSVRNTGFADYSGRCRQVRALGGHCLFPAAKPAFSSFFPACQEPMSLERLQNSDAAK